MPTFDIVKQPSKFTTFRTRSIVDRYELTEESQSVKLNGSIDIEGKDWSVGLIVGSSGSGKSTIAKRIFGDFYIDRLAYDDKKAIIDEMPSDKELDCITETFNSCGLGTIWTWLRPYSVLSTGEKMRCDLARALLEDREIIVFDEFTSVVDRDIARLAASCVSKTIKKSKKKFVAVSCHRDIVEWLEPDWVYDTDTKEFFFVRDSIRDHDSTSRYLGRIDLSGNALSAFTI